MRLRSVTSNAQVRTDLLLVAVGVVYLLAAKLGLSMAFAAEQVSLVWPPTGLALVIVLWGGYRVWPGIWVGAFLANLTSHEPLMVAAAIAAGNTLEALTAAWLLRRLVGIDQSFERFKPTLGLVVYGALVSTVVSATIGTTSLCLGGVQPWHSYGSLWSNWWLGDAMGDLLVAPVLLTWSTWPRLRSRRRIAEAGVLFTSLALVSVLVFSGRLANADGRIHSFAYALFPFVMWAALRFGHGGAALASLLASAIAVGGTIHGTGPFASESVTEGLILLQMFMAVMAATGLLLGAVVAENRAAIRKRNAEHDITRILADARSLGDAVPRILQAIATNLHWDVGFFWVPDADGRLLRCADVWSGPSARPSDVEGLVGREARAAGHDLPGRIWTNKVPVWIPHPAADLIDPPTFKGSRDPAFGFPIRLDGEIFGVLEFRRRKPYGVDHIRLLQMGAAIGSQIGQFAARKRAELEVVESEARKAGVLDAALDCIVTVDQAGLIIEFNQAAERTLGHARRDVLGRDLADLVLAPPERDAFRRTMTANGDSALLGRRVEVAATRADGSLVPVELSVARVGSVGPPLFTAFLRDISEQRRLVNELVFRASHDPLTHVLNRAAFMERLTGLVRGTDTAGSRMQPQVCGVLLIDLDRFKEFNDRYGHLMGDQLLMAVAHRLTASMRPDDTVARLGGDEFVILMEDIEGMREASSIANRIQQTLSHPFNVAGYQIHATVSMGIAIGADDYRRPEDFLRDADMALYDAKAHGRGRAQVFDPAMHARTMARKELEADLRHAVERREFTVSYQPIKSLRTGKVTCMEALVRWQHPRRGLLEPREFIPLAESTGLIEPLGAWVLRTACAEATSWQEMLTRPAPLVAINVSARQFQRPGLVKAVRDVLTETRLAAASLTLEITESLAMKDIDLTVEAMNDLNATGVQLAIDDFGTGYSSLSCLKHFPIKTLKIDQSFVRHMAVSADDAAIVAATIAMAHTLRLRVVAEGVEEEAQMRFLQKHGCDEVQGHFISAPMPADVLRQRIHEGSLFS